MTTEPIDLDAAQALADAASPGPWRALEGVVVAADRFQVVIPVSSDIIRREKLDAEFIAAARNLVPALIAELRAASMRIEDLADALAETTAELVTVQAAAEFADAHVEGWQKRALDAEAALDRVRALHVRRSITGRECGGCGNPYPCPTIRAIEGGEPC